MILTISGYRYYIDTIFIYSVLDKYFETNTPEVVHIGDATGIDAIATKYCYERNIPYVTHKANWKLYGNSAGPKRNTEMLELSTHLLAFPSPESKGTYNAISTARKMNLVVDIVNI